MPPPAFIFSQDTCYTIDVAGESCRCRLSIAADDIFAARARRSLSAFTCHELPRSLPPVSHLRTKTGWPCGRPRLQARPRPWPRWATRPSSAAHSSSRAADTSRRGALQAASMKRRYPFHELFDFAFSASTSTTPGHADSADAGRLRGELFLRRFISPHARRA